MTPGLDMTHGGKNAMTPGHGQEGPEVSSYLGKELEFFALATNWKKYLGDSLRRHIAGDVIEVGAGIGETTKALRHSAVRAWTCVEPDKAMAAEIARRAASGELGDGINVCNGTLADLPPDQSADTVIYIDVLEHIEDDRGEVNLAASRVRPGGNIVVLCPAYQLLYSPFDAAIGHHRRYTVSALRKLAPRGFEETATFYLDSVGVIASLANKLLLRQSLPTSEQIRLWDRRLVPISRWFDPIVMRRFGRSAVIVWRKR